MIVVHSRIELSAEEGFVISNAATDWELMPTSENFENPPIQISNAPLKNGKVISNIDDCVELNECSDISSDFANGYIRALHGELKGWSLVGIRITDMEVTFLFAERSTGRCEFVYTKPGIHMWVSVSVEDFNHQRVQYLLTVTHCNPSENQPRIELTEYTPLGKRVTCFNLGHSRKEDCSDTEWFYAYVTEYR